MSPPETTPIGECIRAARMDDAEAVCSLYLQTYAGQGPGALDQYPFPQLFDADSVRSMIAGDDILWKVAEDRGGAIIGSAGALRNIGGPQDWIAEVFGVVVDSRCRTRGIGTAIMIRLLGDLTSSVECILCEARTAEPGGWRVARNAGLVPIGYEPYAHAMPVGFESMVLTGGGRWLTSCNPTRGPSPGGRVDRIARSVLDCLTKPDVEAHIPPRPISLERQVREGAAPVVRRYDPAARAWFSAHDAHDHRAGVLGLSPLVGVDCRGVRFEHPCYVAYDREREVGCARVVWDRVDARARILGLRIAAEGVRHPLLAGIVDDLTQRTRDGHLIIVVWVRADATAAQLELNNLGFFPTAYLPRMIVGGEGRTDGVQYTRLSGKSLLDSVDGVSALAWPAAQAVVEEVLRSA